MYRGRFCDSYALGKDRYQRAKGLRLMDCELRRYAAGAEGYLDPLQKDEFAVVDTVTHEKAYFQAPQTLCVDAIGKMIANHFAAIPVRIAARIWIV